VLGYVIMRIAMVFQWLRAARQDPARRRTCLTYAAVISIAQFGWVAQIIFDVPVGLFLILTCILLAIELAGPFIAERKDGGTSWHAHHIAERRQFDFLHVWLLAGTAAVVALAVIAARAGIDMAVCLVILMLAPAVTVVGYEMQGYRHQADALAKEERWKEH
jgi:hypothetical protein